MSLHIAKDTKSVCFCSPYKQTRKFDILACLNVLSEQSIGALPNAANDVT
jgi:hypothetical protein